MNGQTLQWKQRNRQIFVRETRPTSATRVRGERTCESLPQQLDPRPSAKDVRKVRGFNVRQWHSALLKYCGHWRWCKHRRGKNIEVCEKWCKVSVKNFFESNTHINSFKWNENNKASTWVKNEFDGGTTEIYIAKWATEYYWHLIIKYIIFFWHFTTIIIVLEEYY